MLFFKNQSKLIKNNSLMALLFIFFQYLIPQKTLSFIMGHLAQCQQKKLKNFLIKKFIKMYKVDMSEAIDPDPKAYKNFNDFFTRKLNINARIIHQDEKIILSPVDGKIYQVGKIANDQLIQAKDKSFSLQALLADQADLTKFFIHGEFITLYLAPKDYHRVHMPCAGTLRKMIYVSGKLFSVNPITTNNISNLFARNERVICIFDTLFGPMAVILVGALIVGSIHTAWAGVIKSPSKKQIFSWNYDDKNSITLEQGAELGHFQLGSTVIVLFPENKIKWDEKILNGSHLKMGREIGFEK